jgi:fatty acid/phospholipid biosynthesis enzyme
MNDDVIADLKQFIAATVSQQMSGFVTKDDLKGLATKDDIARVEGDIAVIKNDVTGLKGGVARVEQKIDDLQESVAEALNNANDAVEEQIDKRLAAHVQQYHQASARLKVPRGMNRQVYDNTSEDVGRRCSANS